MAIDLTQYVTVNINSDTYYLLLDIDDQLALAVKLADLNNVDNLAGAVAPLYIVNSSTGNLHTLSQ